MRSEFAGGFRSDPSTTTTNGDPAIETRTDANIVVVHGDASRRLGVFNLRALLVDPRRSMQQRPDSHNHQHEYHRRVGMKCEDDIDRFVRAPVGRWHRVASGVVWCQSRERCGVAVWGEPSSQAMRDGLTLFERGWDSLAPSFDVLMDVTRVTHFPADAFADLVEWTLRHKTVIVGRVRSRVSIVPPGILGFALAGIASILDGLDNVRVVTDPTAGYATFCRSDAEGRALRSEVTAILDAAGAVPELLQQLRAALRVRGGKLALHEAARLLTLSTRSLQRILRDNATSFRDEVHDARARAALEMLEDDNTKIAAIAARLGITEATLARVVRQRTSLTPSEYRTKRRSR